MIHVISLICSAGLLALWAAVLKQLWCWFICDYFVLPDLSFGLSAGIAIIAALLTHTMHIRASDLEEQDKPTRWKLLFVRTFVALYRCLFLLLLGWIATFFIGL